MKKTVGIAMVGCGGMAVSLGKKLFRDRPELELRAVCDPKPESIRKTLEALGPDAKVYRDHRELVRDPAVDWVMIASWNCFHKEQSVAAFRAGKHVFCQKPLATTLADCAAMRRAWEASGRMFTIGFTLRYSPFYRKIRELLETKAIGNIVSMEFNETLDFNHGGYIMGDWRRLTEYAGTHLLEKCCHDIDLANWMVGSKARRVASFGGLDFFLPRNAKHIRRLGKDAQGRQAYRTWPGKVSLNPFTAKKDIIDNQVAIIEYENSVRATFHTNCNAGIPERRMYILGSEGAIRANVIEGTIQLRRIGFGTAIENIETGASGGHGGGDQVLADELAASMTRHAPSSTSLADGLKSAVTCFAIDDAMTRGQVVQLKPYWKRVGVK